MDQFVAGSDQDTSGRLLNKPKQRGPMDRSPHIVFAPAEVIGNRRNAQLAATLDLVFDRHPAYRQLTKTEALSRNDLQSIDDLSKLPVTTKIDYMNSPEDYRLEANGLSPEEAATWDVMHTTGTTTGKPTPFYSTAYDFYRILSVQEGMMRLRGVDADDVIANLFPLTVWPHGAYARVPHAAAALKIPVINTLPGNPSEHFGHGSGMDDVIGLVERHRATILWGVPSYVRRVLIRAAELGADFSSVRHVFITGEAAPETLRKDFTDRLSTLGANKVFVSISYGATEMQGGMVECVPGSGFHNPAPDQFHISIVDPENHQPLSPGKRGMVLLSHLDRRGTVLLRYALGDISVLADGPCPHCGSSTDRLIETPTRMDSLLKIRGMLVNPALMEDILLAEPSVSEYQMVVERQNPDDPLSPDRLRIRIAGEAPNIAEKIKAATGVTPEIEFSDAQKIYAPGDTLKSKRVIDRRD